MAALRIEIERTADGHAVVHLAGEFDMADELAFSRAVTDGVLTEGYAEVRLDCEGLTFIDSMGLRGLVRAKKKAQARGVGFTITGLHPAVRKVLEITDLLGWFDPQA